MSYSGLRDFISRLENENELIRISQYVDPVLEMAEITDRIVKNGGKALLFENNGTDFPVLMNAYGSDMRIAEALGCDSLDKAAGDIDKLFTRLAGTRGTFLDKLKTLPGLIKISGYLPSRIHRKGGCQKVIHMNPDLGMLPVIKCWPHDSGRFITLPIVHTMHPGTGATNAGMYRMQILDSRTTGMHWQRHKTGSNHYHAWKQDGRIMPVSVALGGDPVYAWAATAPLPENIDEYILAGFLRRKKVSLVKCLTNDLWVPADADFIIEGYVDPSEDLFPEGPFGDHTGFYSLSDLYPKFHVTCITHSDRAVYPATIVGIPPQEDAYFSKAAEKIFLPPIRLTLQPEILDLHMPDPGVSHNLVIVSIKKSYPGQGKKVISSLFGAGQMMFTKYLVVVSGDVDIRDYSNLTRQIFKNTSFRRDLLFSSGPLDVLDHASEVVSLGGKLGIDATVKLPEEILPFTTGPGENDKIFFDADKLKGLLPAVTSLVNYGDNQVLVLGFDSGSMSKGVAGTISILKRERSGGIARLALAVDNNVCRENLCTVAWQVLANSDPQRDISFLSDDTILIDGTTKAFRDGGFPRRWPNPVCSSAETIRMIDSKWHTLGLGPFLPSPSDNFSKLAHRGADFIVV